MTSLCHYPFALSLGLGRVHLYQLRWRGCGVLLAALALLAADSPTRAQQRPPSPSQSTPEATVLPRPVAELVEALQAAVASGDIEDVRESLAWNEMKPDVGGSARGDPIAHWRSLSADGSGRETLALLEVLLSEPPAIMPLGRDIENNRLYVWPGFAETALNRLTATQREQFHRLVPDAEREAMLVSRRYTGPRLVIGADGTWHRLGPDR